jgi:hypothetical protein
MRNCILIITLILISLCSSAQVSRKELPAKRTTSSFKIDGVLEEAAWLEAIPATDFIEWRPDAGIKLWSTSFTITLRSILAVTVMKEQKTVFQGN